MLCFESFDVEVFMTRIIELEAYRASRRLARSAPAEPARILLFMGVRYERHEDGLASPTSDELSNRGKTPPRGRRRRAS